MTISVQRMRRNIFLVVLIVMVGMAAMLVAAPPGAGWMLGGVAAAAVMVVLALSLSVANGLASLHAGPSDDAGRVDQGDLARAGSHPPDVVAQMPTHADPGGEPRPAGGQMNEEFRQGVHTVLGQVDGSVRELRETLEDMANGANDTSIASAAVASAAGQIASHVGALAQTTEALSVTVDKVSRHITLSSDVAHRAVNDSGRVSGIVARLSDATRQIGNVVDLINQIASQTNMLALNATIEAARAGDAGKGFAVVANEVKHLAAKTATATRDIAAQIATVQAATAEVTDAISGISDTVRQIGDTFTTIASDVEEQAVATRAIAETVQQAAAETRAVTDEISNINIHAEKTGAMVTMVMMAVDTLGEQSRDLTARLA